MFRDVVADLRRRVNSASPHGIEMNYLSSSGKSGSLAVVASAFVGLAIGWIDIHTTEVAATIVRLLLAGAVLGFRHPRGAWRWSLILTAGIPIVAAVGTILKLPTAEPLRFDPRIYLVVFVFALAGSHSGAIGRRLVQPGVD